MILSGEPPGKRKLESGSNRRMGVSICVFCHSYEAHFIIVMTSALKHWTLGGGIPPHLKRPHPIFGEPAPLNQLRSIDSGVGSSRFFNLYRWLLGTQGTRTFNWGITQIKSGEQCTGVTKVRNVRSGGHHRCWWWWVGVYIGHCKRKINMAKNEGIDSASHRASFSRVWHFLHFLSDWTPRRLWHFENFHRDTIKE